MGPSALDGVSLWRAGWSRGVHPCYGTRKKLGSSVGWTPTQPLKARPPRILNGEGRECSQDAKEKLRGSGPLCSVHPNQDKLKDVRMCLCVVTGVGKRLEGNTLKCRLWLCLGCRSIGDFRSFFVLFSVFCSEFMLFLSSEIIVGI